MSSSVFNASRLQGKTVLITGASVGIGAETAILFSKAGCNVIITARRKPQLDIIAERCKAANKARTVPLPKRVWTGRNVRKRNSGHIINLGSLAGREPYAGGGIYCATKTGSLLRELVSTKIRVTEIDPGMVQTEFARNRFRGDEDSVTKLYADLEPLVAYDIAEEIVWAASRPDHVVVAESFIVPKCQAGSGIYHREAA
ncbi:hypothetical protein MNV49_007043 [Pseudohyphozyma bogoriensis]|nr:hypothetical protein MNV49_007043 [Pseudohyphozyma bogoriensis]